MARGRSVAPLSLQGQEAGQPSPAPVSEGRRWALADSGLVN